MLAQPTTSTSTASMTVVGAFEDREAASQAVAALQRAGFSRDLIGFAARNRQGEAEYRDPNDATNEGEAAGEGAAVGAAIGAGIGGLVGLGVIAGVVPVIGPAIAAGTLGTILSNVAGGAAVAGLAGALTGWGVSEADVDYYEGEFESGRTLVTVRADARAPEARRILNEHGALPTPRSDMGT